MSSLLERKLQKAFDCLRENDITGAENLCQAVLGKTPRQPEALHLLGVIRLRQGSPADASSLIERALAGDPGNVSMLENLGAACLAAGNLDRAEAVLLKVIKLDAFNALAQMRLGIVYGQQGKLSDSVAALDKAADLAPAEPYVFQNLGNALASKGDAERALEAFRRTVALQPGNVEAWFNIGVVCQTLERLDEGCVAYLRALTLDANHRGALNNLGWVYRQTGNFEKAAGLYRLLVSLDGNDSGALHNLGIVMRLQGKLEEASVCYEKALIISPSYVDAWVSLGVVREHQGQFAEARQCYEKALSINPSSKDARYSFSLACLTAGDLDKGWPDYRARTTRLLAEYEGSVTPDLGIGDETRAVTILGEQGLGDELFFLRFVPELRELGFVLNCQCDIKIRAMVDRTGLFERVSATGDPIPQSGKRILIGDLPQFISASKAMILPTMVGDGEKAGAEAVDRSSESRSSKIVPGPLKLVPLSDRLARMEARLERLGPRPYIGVTWRAGTPMALQHARIQQSLYKEIPLDRLISVLKNVSGTLFSLQRLPETGETALLRAALGQSIHDFSGVNEDLEDMLALMTLLDDYVGLSNTNMHLRAGVGKGARVLVPHPPEWRWMTEGNSSPWFPGFSVYRQSADLDWSRALDQLANDLPPIWGGVPR